MSKIEVSGQVSVAPIVFQKMIGEIIIDNKDLFIDKSYLKQKNDKKAVNVIVNNENKSVEITLDLNASYAKNINTIAVELQNDIKRFIENITGYTVEKIDINIIKLVK